MEAKAECDLHVKIPHEMHRRLKAHLALKGKTIRMWMRAQIIRELREAATDAR